MKVSEYRQNMRDKVAKAAREIDADTQSALDTAGDRAEVGNLIAIINDNGASALKKGAAIDALNTISNFSPLLRARMPEIVNALRGHMDSGEQDLRERALGTLTAMKDEVAQERLVAEIVADKPEAEKLLPTAKSIAMLGRDEKSLPLAVLRQVISNPPDDACLIEALRHLPSEPEAFGALRAVMENDDAPLEARAMIPEMACEMDAPAFVSAARDLLKSKGAEHELAPFLAKGVAGANSAEAAEEVRAAKAEISALAEAAPEAFKSAAAALLANEDPPSDP
ncbi:MAG: hypothetical protein AAF458_08795 [Pseudomonadota bacterium]